MHQLCVHGLRFWLLLAAVWALRPPTDSAPIEAIDVDRDRALYFSPVDPSFRETTKKNVLHLVSSGAVDVFLAHYQLDLDEWRKEEWYNQSVKYSVAYKASKPTFVLNELVNQQTFRLSGYRWYWITDHNIDFTHLNVGRYFSLAAESGASIVQPAIVLAYTEPVELANHSLSRSLYRYTDFVEVMSPMFSAAALPVAWKLYIPGLGSDFGMDSVWCRYVAAKLQGQENKACAIIDAVQMFKLPHIQSYSFQDAVAVAEVVQKLHPEYLQRSIDRNGNNVVGLSQLCRPAGNRSLVLIGPKTWNKELSGCWKLIVAFFRCKLGYSLMAACHINPCTVLFCLAVRGLALTALLACPFLLWFLLRWVLSLAGIGGSRTPQNFAQKRAIRAPYRHRPWSDAS